MGTTKRQLVSDVYAELALAGYEFDIQPEEEQFALRKLEAMMGTWNAMGVQVGYAFGSDLNADSGLDLQTVEAVVLNGAIRVAAGKGKALAASTKTAAKAALDSVMLVCAKAQLQETQRQSSTPAGAGNRRWSWGGRPFLPSPTDDTVAVDAGGVTFIGN